MQRMKLVVSIHHWLLKSDPKKWNIMHLHWVPNFQLSQFYQWEKRNNPESVQSTGYILTGLGPIKSSLQLFSNH